jgi:hypothetical protein
VNDFTSRPNEPPTPSAASRWLRAVAFAGGAAAAVLAMYLLHPILAGHRLPIGPDGVVYPWLARAADAGGFGAGPGAGPGVPGLTLVLGGILGTDALATVTLLGPLLAAAAGLAAAGLVEAALGPKLDRALLAVVLTGAFTAYLAGGWLANVAMVAIFLSAVAALAVAGRSWRAVTLAAALLGAAGLSHRVFFVVGLVILVPVVVARIPDAVRVRRAGGRWRDTAAGRMGVAVAIGGGLGAAGVAWLAAGPRIPGDTSQDGFFRRLGMRDFLIDRYRERFWGDLSRAAVPVVTGVGLAVAGGRPTAQAPIGHTDDGGDRFLLALWLSWAAVTAGGVVLLAATAWGPPNRLLQFAFLVPIGGAVGAAALRRRGAGHRAIAAGAVVVFVAVSMFGWFRQSPAFTTGELRAVARAREAIDALPAGTPLVFVVDTDEPAAAYHITRAGNVIRNAVPADLILDVRLAVGRPEDVLAGRVTETGDPEHDLIARAYLSEVGPLLPTAAVFVLRAFNEEGWAETAGVAPVAPGVVQLQPTAQADSTASRTAGGELDLDGLGPAELVGLSVLTLIVLGFLGAGWARWGLPRAGHRAAAAVAPSAGIAVAVWATFVADRLGFGPGSGLALGLVVVLGAAGYILAWSRNRGARPDGPVPPAERPRVLDEQGG